MKRANTIVSVIVIVAILLAAFGVGLCIREIRFRRAGVDSRRAQNRRANVASISEANQPPRMLAPGVGAVGGDRNLSADERASLVEERGRMRERFENMSEEEREQFRSQMRDRFSGRQRGRDEMFQNLSEEERARLEEERRNMRERWDAMSEEEREEYRSQMRERFSFGGRARSDGSSSAEQPGENDLD